MTNALVLCEGCKRHVFAHEAACPFCRASLGAGSRGLAAAALLSAGLSLAGCGRGPEPPAAVYGGPPQPLNTAPQSAPPPPAPPPSAIPAPAYGGPPPIVAPPPTATASTTASAPKPVQRTPVPIPAYGRPPPRNPDL
jgi:hypothetical protein